jgi:hypothetical protein
MSTLLRILLISSIAFFAIMAILKPRQLRQFGRKARLVGLIYVAVIVTSAVLDVVFGWRT